MQVTGTHIAYLHTCARKLWLFANGLSMEHTSEVVAEGKLIDDTSYPDRASKFTEVEIDGVKIDYYDARNRKVHEVKKSASVERAHVAQVKYYLFKLRQTGIEGASGIIEYPRLKQRQQVACLTLEETGEISNWEREVQKIVASHLCPEVIRARICKQCSYHDFCYSGEKD
jgi:CRISPR-associated exonuclease Cas4